MEYPTLEEYKQIIQEGTYKISDYPNLHLTFCHEIRSGNRSVVFKMHDEIKNKSHALKCFFGDSDNEFVKNRERNYCKFEHYFKELPSYLVSFKHIVLLINSSLYKGDVFAIMMDWVEGQTMRNYLNELNVWLPNSLARHRIVYLRFVQIAADLIKSKFAHGNITLDNIIIQDDNDVKLISYDNMYIPSLDGEQSDFNLTDLDEEAKDNFPYYEDSFLRYSILGDPFSEESIEDSSKTELEERFKQHDEYIDSIPLLWITINLKFYLTKTRNKALVPFLFGNSETAVLFPCGDNIIFEGRNVIEQLIKYSEDFKMGSLLSLYISALNFMVVKAEDYVIAALNITEKEINLIDNYYQLGGDYSNIKESYSIDKVLKKNCLEVYFSLQELLNYKDILRWDVISKNRNIVWSSSVVDKLKYHINWSVFVQNQDLNYLSEEKISFLRAGCLWVDRYFESLKCIYFGGTDNSNALYLKQEMSIWFWNFVNESFDEGGDFYYSINCMMPVLHKYWVNSLNYDSWYQRRIKKKIFCLPIEFIVAFSYWGLYSHLIESDKLLRHLIRVKEEKKPCFYMDDYWEEYKCEEVQKLDSRYLCLDEHVCINYELIRYWLDDETLDTVCWKALSANRSFSKTVDIIESFVNYWDWSILCDEENLPIEIWTIDFLQNYKDKLDWNILSDKDQIGNLLWNEELLNIFIDKWNWYILCNNQSEVLWTEELYQLYKDKWNELGVTYPIIYNKTNFENSEIDKDSDNELDQGENFAGNCNGDLSLQFIQYNYSEIFKYSCYERTLEKLNFSIRWSYTLLSVFEDDWEWSLIRKNLKIPWKLSWLVNYKNKISWYSYDDLFLNPYIPLTPQILNEIKKSHISSWQLSMNPLFLNNIDLLAKYWNENVIISLNNEKKQRNANGDINSILGDNLISVTDGNKVNVNAKYYKIECSVPESSIDESLKYTFESKFGNEKSFKWTEISNDKYLIWEDRFILEHKEDINWGKINWCRKYIGREGDYEDFCTVTGLCANPSIHWSKERLKLFKGSVIWNVLAARDDIKVPWFCANEQLRKHWYEELWKDLFPWMENYNDTDILDISTRQSIYWKEDDLQAFNWIYNGEYYLYRDEYDIMRMFWENISNSPNVDWSVDLIQKYIQRWDWGILSKNLAVIKQTDILTSFKEKFNWESYTILRYLFNQWDCLELYKDLLDWSKLCCYYWNGDESFLKRFEEYIDWSAISKNKQFAWTEELITEYENCLDWYALSSNSSVCWDVSLISKYEERVDWDALSSNSSVCWDVNLISKYEDKIDWDILVTNKGVQWCKEIVEKFYYRIDINALYEESKFPWGFVANSSLIELDWRKISQSSLCTHDFVKTHKRYLNWNDLSRNDRVLWTMDYINEFSDYWNYALLSGNIALPWSVDLIDKYIDRWDWDLLPLNNAIPWDEQLVSKYFDRLSIRNIKRYIKEKKESKELKECKIEAFFNGWNLPYYTISDKWKLIVFLETVKRNLIKFGKPTEGYFDCRNIFETVYSKSKDKSFDRDNDYEDDWDSVSDNPYYDDNLDMDQQSPEFWNNL